MSVHHYRHTQTGWAIIVAMVVIAALSVPIIRGSGANPLAFAIVGAIILLMALFSSLTVVVDKTHLAFRFTFGLVRKRIALEAIRHYQPVRNPWYYGWGIHLYPGGVLYNVSGFQAVEILLQSGARLRLGTDEPDSLSQAIESVIGTPRPLLPQELKQIRTARNQWLLVMVSILILVLGGIGLLVYLEEQAPTVTISEEVFMVEGLFYAEALPLAEITEVSLCQHLPRILARTNGYSSGRTLRGHFRLAEIGDGQLFIRPGRPPYLFARSQTDYVIVNFGDPARTRAVYTDLMANWAGSPKDCPRSSAGSQ